MCKECGCGSSGGGAHVQMHVNGYTEENAIAVERALRALPGVLYVHIHTHDGETTLDYNPEKTQLGDVVRVLKEHRLQPLL